MFKYLTQIEKVTGILFQIAVIFPKYGSYITHNAHGSRIKDYRDLKG